MFVESCLLSDTAFMENISFIQNCAGKHFVGKEQDVRRASERERRKSERMSLARKGLWHRS
jgi:hypothetical protein